MYKCLDLCKVFPDEDSRYDANIKLTYIGMAISVLGLFSSTVFDLSIIVDLLAIVFYVVLIYVTGYVWIKARILSYVFKVIVGLIISVFIYGILFAISGGIGAVAVLGFIVFAFTQTKRREFLKKYKRYVSYTIILLVSIIVGYMVSFSAVAMAAFGLKHSIVGLGAALGVFITIFGPSFVTLYILKKERARKTPFLEMCFLMTTVPITMLFLFLSYISIAPHYFNGDAFIDELNTMTLSDIEVTPDNTVFANTNTASTTSYDMSNNINIDHTDIAPSPMQADATIALTNIGTTDSVNIDTSLTLTDIVTSPNNHAKPISYQISDSSGMIQGHIVNDGETAKIYDNENNLLGNIAQDAGTSVLKDSQQNTVLTRDSSGFISTPDGAPIAHIEDGGSVETICSTETSEFVVKDEINGVIHDGHTGKILGRINK